MKVSALASKMVLLSAFGMLSMATTTTASAADAATLRSETRRMDTMVTSQGSAQVQGSLATQFSGFAGSEANAQSLVTGLRSGTLITLTSTSTTGGTTTTTAITLDPPTRPMGYGNVFISLALAEQQLAGYGITDPTPQEIQAALTGGTITTGSGTAAQTITLKGILTQRAEGMGWGNIARSQGMNLGHVVSGLKSANKQVAATSPAVNASAATSGRAAAESATQTTTATSTSVRGNSASAPGHNRGAATSSGIVTAAGTSLGGSAGANVNAGARASGAGIVTGGGAAVTARGGLNAQGQAKGLNKP